MSALPSSIPFAPGLDVAARSIAGAGAAVRAENQDNFLLIDGSGMASFLSGQQPQQRQVEGWPAGHARVAVLDGMGGHGHGREAAEAVVAGLLRIPACTSLEELSLRLEALHNGLQRQFGAGGDPGKRPGTTLTMLELRPGQPALLYHVGDSRLYQITGGRIMPLTIDHVPATVCAMARSIGEPDWWQQVHGEHRSQISQAFILGNAFADPNNLGDALFALDRGNLPAWLAHLQDRRLLELDPHSVYVLATDGFWACDDPVEAIVRWPALLDPHLPAAGLCERLFADMLQAPPAGLYPDNLTAVVLRVAPGSETALPVAEHGHA